MRSMHNAPRQLRTERRTLIRRDEIINLRHLDHPQESSSVQPRQPHEYMHQAACTREYRLAQTQRNSNWTLRWLLWLCCNSVLDILLKWNFILRLSCCNWNVSKLDWNVISWWFINACVSFYFFFPFCKIYCLCCNVWNATPKKCLVLNWASWSTVDKFSKPIYWKTERHRKVYSIFSIYFFM